MIVRDKRVLVVGAGRIAARKIASVVELGADVRVVAPEVNDEVRTLAEANKLTLDEREFRTDDVDGAWLVFTATGDRAVDRSVHDAAERAHIWVNSADDPVNCSVTLLSLIRRGDLVVAIGTGGRSPALAAHLRRRLEAEIGPEYEALLDLLAEARESLRTAGRSSEDADWQRAFDSGIVELVRSGRIADAKELLQQCL
jgi:precorrin-2 dehydrogenase/sirohydrochlorin ferrochelatase